MTRNTLIKAFGVLAFVIASPAMAKGPSWDYMSAAWTVSGKFEMDPFEEDTEGYQIAAFKSLGDTFFFSVRSDARSVDFLVGPPIDFTTHQLSFGGRFPVSPNVDLWASLNYERFGFASYVGTGFGVDVGARWMVSNAFELGLTAKVGTDLDFEDVEDVIPDYEYSGHEITAAYLVSPSVAITLSYGNYKFEEMDGGDEAEASGMTLLGVRLSY